MRSIINVVTMRLRLMYSSIEVRILAVMLVIIIIMLIHNLYADASDSSRIKIGIAFNKTSEVTQGIHEALMDNEIIQPIIMTEKEGIKAVKENRIQAFFVFHADIEEKLAAEDYSEVCDLYFLEDNFLPYILADVVGSEMIGEIVLRTVMNFMREAIEGTDTDISGSELYFDTFYRTGKEYLVLDTGNTYVNVEYKTFEGHTDEKKIELENVQLFKRVILGIVYVFIVFYIVFLVVNMVRDQETGIRTKWLITPMKSIHIVIGEYVSVVIGSLPIVFAITVIQYIFEGNLRYFILVNLLFVMANAGFIMLVGKLLSKVTVFVIATTSIILIFGIVSGSFFMIDSSSVFMRRLTLIMPSYHILQEMVESGIKGLEGPSTDYVNYMLIYSGVTFTISALIEKCKIRLEY